MMILHTSKFCMKLDRLILKKIIKIVATRCQILRLKCTKFDFGWGSAPDPAGIEAHAYAHYTSLLLLCFALGELTALPQTS